MSGNHKKPNKKAKGPENQKDPQESIRRPNWPCLDLSVSHRDLEIDTVLEGQIVTIPQFWPQSLCKKYVKFLASLSFTTTPSQAKKGEALRVNDRFQIDDPSFAETLWSQTGLKGLIMERDKSFADGKEANLKQSERYWGGEVLGLNSNIRIYRYRKGQFFDKHYDDSNMILFPDSNGKAAYTTWTLLLYLTSAKDGCVGGETVFYPDSKLKTSDKDSKSKPAFPSPIETSPETGMALLHRHGKQCMLHEGKEVVDGEKWIIRSDLCVKR